jgi:hypothetical protein
MLSHVVPTSHPPPPCASCLIAEICQGNRLFNGYAELQIKTQIMDLYGTPTAYELSQNPIKVDSGKPKTLRATFSTTEGTLPGVTDVIDGLLQWAPRMRLTAEAAGRMPFFATFAPDPESFRYASLICLVKLYLTR